MSEGSGIRQKVSALKQLELEERGEQSTAQLSSVPGDRSERDCTSVGELPMTLRISDGQYQKDCAIRVPAALAISAMHRTDERRSAARELSEPEMARVVQLTKLQTCEPEHHCMSQITNRYSAGAASMAATRSSARDIVKSGTRLRTKKRAPIMP